MIHHASKGSAPRKIKLSSRDFKLLELAAKQKFLTIQDVAQFWTSNKSHHHYERMRDLCQAGFFQPLLGDQKIRLGYRLMPKGISHLPTAELKSSALVMTRIGYRTGFGHDRLLHEVRSALETLPIVSNFRSEAQVRSIFASRHGKKEQKGKGYKVPDGLFQLSNHNGDFKVAIEVELSVKAEARYHSIFRELLLQPDFDIVFYLTGQDDIKKMLIRILADVRAEDLVVQTARRQNRIYFASLRELLTNKAETVFEGEGSTFPLNSLLP